MPNSRYMLLLAAGLRMFNHLINPCYLDHKALRKTQQHIPADVGPKLRGFHAWRNAWLSLEAIA